MQHFQFKPVRNMHMIS